MPAVAQQGIVYISYKAEKRMFLHSPKLSAACAMNGGHVRCLHLYFRRVPPPLLSHMEQKKLCTVYLISHAMPLRLSALTFPLTR